jgi:tight adherence protein B
MRRTAAILALALAAILVPGAGAADSLSLVQAGNVSFPDRAFVLTTPTPLNLHASDLRLLENGKPVTGLTLTPAREAAKGKFGVVLVLDASRSMAGKPIANAVAAARAFALRRAPNEELGIVTFNRGAHVGLVPTTDAAALAHALASSPQLVTGTYIYDAVAASLNLLRKAHVNVGSIVLLSDGADTGSRLRVAQVTARANAAHVRVFTVGLRSRQFRASTLQGLAHDTGGFYSEPTSPSGLTPIFQALSEQLSNEYLLQYRSPAQPDALVRVQLSVKGAPGTAVAAYKTPALSSTALQPFHRSAWQRFWLSPASMVFVSLAAGLLAALTIGGLLGRRRAPLRERMTEFVTATGDLRVKQQEKVSHSLVALDRALSRVGWWGRFKEDLAIAEFPVPAPKLAAITLVATIVLAWLVGLVLPPVFIVFALGLPFVARALVKRKLDERREKFNEQLPDNLNVLASALRAGHSFIGALSVLVDEADQPAQAEFRRALADEQLGVPVEDALVAVAKRMANDDLEQVALVALLQRQTGGNTAEVLDTVVDTIRERSELRRLVRTLTAQGRMSRWILSGLPIFLGLLITVINPAYVRPLYHTSTGQMMLAVAVAMVIAGSLAIQRIIDIKV